MLRLIADENFNGDIVRGLLLRRPQIDVVRAQDVGLAGASDPQILSWAAEDNRTILTHDRATMPYFAFQCVELKGQMAGVFVVNDRLPVAQSIEEIILMDECSEQAEWNGFVIYLPL